MAFRKWLIRLFVLAVLIGGGAGYYVYQRWATPEAVRAAVLTELGERFPGAIVRLESARLQLLGGIQLTDLQMIRRDDPQADPFASAPTVVLYPDKEELAHGKLVIRKIELDQPHLHLVRRADGTWNLADILAATDPDEPVPMIEVQQGKLTVTDEMVPGATVLVRDVSLTAIPAENASLKVHATGTSDSLGELQLDGTINRRTGALALSAKLSQTRVDSAFLERVAQYVPQVKEHGQGLEGTATTQVELVYHPDSPQPWSYDLRVQLSQARYENPQLPFPLENLEAGVHCDGRRLTLERLQAKVAGTSIAASAELQALTPDADLQAQIKTDGLHIDKNLYGKLPPNLQELCADVSPTGLLSMACEFRRKAGRWHIRHTVRPQGLAILYDKFPYPVDGLTGTLVQETDESEGTSILTIDLAGLASGRPVRVTGKITGEGRQADLQLDVTGENIPIDKQLLAALPAESREIAQRFSPTGQVNFLAELRRPARTETLQYRYLMNFHHATMRYKDFPYPLEEVEGTLEVVPDAWRFYNCRGRHKEGEFQAVGQSEPIPPHPALSTAGERVGVRGDGDHITVIVKGTNALLDQEMESALNADMKSAWDQFRPSGRVDFTARVDQIADKPSDLDLQITARKCSMKAPCFPYALTDVTGGFRYAKRRVVFDKFQARHGETAVSLEGGELILKQGGGFWVDLKQLRAEPIAIDQEFMDAVPELVRKVFRTLAPDKPIRIVTRLTLDNTPGQPSSYYWDGYVGLANSKLNCGVELSEVTGIVACRGTHDGKKLDARGHIQLDQATLFRQPFRNIESDLRVTNDAIVMPGIRAKLHGGEVYGPIRIDFTPDPQYQVNLTASEVDLEQFARQTLSRGAKVRGKAAAQFYLTGKGADLGTMRGRGKLDIPDGHLYDLPVIFDLLMFLSGRLPAGASFEEAHAQFTIEGERVNVSQLELMGNNAITLHGQGSLRTDGTDMDLEMYGLLWGRGLPLLPPLIDKIPPALSKQLMKIRIRGNLGKLDIGTEPVPLVVEPVRQLLEAVTGRQKTQNPRRP